MTIVVLLFLHSGSVNWRLSLIAYYFFMLNQKVKQVNCSSPYLKSKGFVPVTFGTPLIFHLPLKSSLPFSFSTVTLKKGKEKGPRFID